MLIAVDFDGTIVEHKYPKIGREIPFATDTLKRLIQDGHRLILWTIRYGTTLQEAVDWCKERGVEFWSVNSDFAEQDVAKEERSPKVKCDMYIDDRNVGGLPDWGTIYDMITNNLTYETINPALQREDSGKKKKKGWLF
ncbi:MAG: hypothetical protein IKH47_03105 [Bacteroidaceae bacterium]|jgi:hypothetical protein|nr:hypothetical protein [Bacteroidaceae bacterium]MBR3373205.1 hypothetical protein [Bacteroidaceae bacterium]MBR3633931.1 hypothetical protein [Bacteroidaceae bacterium]MBR4649202.1 hypothetical protein [Bacteroidaceae bacterium]MDO4951741.1 hypothetical protein [Bacteroidales bacterium]